MKLARARRGSAAQRHSRACAHTSVVARWPQSPGPRLRPCSVHYRAAAAPGARRVPAGTGSGSHTVPVAWESPARPCFVGPASSTSAGTPALAEKEVDRDRRISALQTVPTSWTRAQEPHRDGAYDASPLAGWISDRRKRRILRTAGGRRCGADLV